MGVRPPADGDDEPDIIEFGIAALDAELSRTELQYPTDERAVREKLGHAEVPIDSAGHSITVAEALEQSKVSQFENEQALLNALHPVFEQRREATRNSLLSQLRALVPF